MISVVIPTYNAARHLPALLDRLAGQTMPHELIVIDSSSKDGTPEMLRRRGIPFSSIPTASFNHGGTRNLGLRRASHDVVVFLTQDALPANDYTLERIVTMLTSDDLIAMAYGRQLPYPGARIFGEFARLHLYPAQSRVKTRADIPELGIRTPSCSNSFAAYRKADLLALGGFPERTIMGEDVIVAAQFILQDRGVAYCAEAEVYHSHDYTVGEELRRYFDIGVFHDEQAIMREFSGAEAQGIRYLLDETTHLIQRRKSHLIPAQFVRVVAKYVGYRAGRMHRNLPSGWRQFLSMSKNYWT